MQQYTLNFLLSAKVNRVERDDGDPVVNVFKPEFRKDKYCINFSYDPGDGMIHAHYMEVPIGGSKTVSLYDGMEMTLSFPYDLLRQGYYECTILM